MDIKSCRHYALFCIFILLLDIDSNEIRKLTLSQVIVFLHLQITSSI